MYERDLDHARSHDLDDVATDARRPGRASASASLEGPSAPVSSGIVMRKARDANGVAADAEAAVATAASSSGSGLPVALQRKFESSLGADLSSVRVHTGGESQSAASAVGARAYTVGQDIHFGAGQYDPSSAGGQHLLAHEVAHTVQQRGGAPTRQNKLEVSAPGDALEHEADRAADAMVVGGPASVTSAGGLVRAVFRQEASEYGPPAPDPCAEEAMELEVEEEAGECSLLPAPLNWGATGAVSASPSTPWMTAPVFDTSYEGDDSIDTYRNAFSASWDEAQSTYQQVWTLHESYKVADREVTPLVRVGEQAGIGTPGANANATESFEGNQLKPSLKNIDMEKAGPAGREEILKQKEEIEALKGTVSIQSDETAKKALGVGKAQNDIASAVDKLNITVADQDIANMNLDANQVKRDLENYKATVKAEVETAKAACDAIATYFNPSKAVDAFKGGIGAVGAIGEAVETHSANDKLARIDGSIRAATNRKASLQQLIDARSIDNMTKTMGQSLIELRQSVQTTTLTKAKFATAYRKLGEALSKAGAASGMDTKDQKQLAAAVEAMPKIDNIIQRITAMQQAVTVPAYNDDSGIGAAMACNAGEFTSHLALIKGNKQYLAELLTTWEARRASVQALIDRVGDMGLDN